MAIEKNIDEVVKVKKPKTEKEWEEIAETIFDFGQDIYQFAQNIELLYNENRDKLLMGDVGLILNLNCCGDKVLQLQLGNKDGVENCIKDLTE